MPRVSVIIPTYNRAHVVGEAIDSVLAQTYQDFEIIVVDDASTDNTREVLDDYARRYPDKVRVIYRDANGGAGAARNDGIRASTGEYIAFLDSDDVYLPRRLESAVEYLDRRPEFGAVYSDYCIAARSGGTPGRGVLAQSGVCPSGWIFRELLRDLGHIAIWTVAITARRGAVGRAGLFDETLRRGQDIEYWRRLSRVCAIGFYPDVTSVARPDRSGGHPDLRSLTIANPAAVSEKALRTMHDLGPTDIRLLHTDIALSYRWRGTLLLRHGRKHAARVWFRRALDYAFRHRLWRVFAEAWVAARVPLLAGLAGWLWRRAIRIRHAAKRWRRRCVTPPQGING